MIDVLFKALMSEGVWYASQQQQDSVHQSRVRHL